jgi:replicative DNA helicase
MTDANLQKLPPQNIEAEQMVLGAVLIENDALLRISDLLHAEDFYKDTHRKIYAAMLSMFNHRESIDLVTLTERVQKGDGLASVGGASYLALLVSLVATSANIRHHAKIVKEKAMLRRVLHWSSDITTKAYAGVTDVRDFFTSMESDLVEMSSSVREKKSPHVTDILAARKIEVEKIQKGDIRRFNIPLFETLLDDPPIPFVYPGFSMVIGGYTSCGKSTLLAQMVVDWCMQGAKVAIFSLEDPQPIKAIKLIANLSDVMQKKILMNNIGGFEDRIQEAEDAIKSWGLLIYDDVRSIDEIMLKVKKHKLQGGLDIVCLDYIQKIQGDGKKYDVLSDAAIKMDDMAKDLQVATVTLSQVNNESVRNPSELMGMKGAGEIESAMDAVLRIKRPKGDDYSLDAELLKNRIFGETGNIPLQFSKFYTRIENRMGVRA